jgi:hypothetical protein
MDPAVDRADATREVGPRTAAARAGPPGGARRRAAAQVWILLRCAARAHPGVEHSYSASRRRERGPRQGPPSRRRPSRINDLHGPMLPEILRPAPLLLVAALLWFAVPAAGQSTAPVADGGTAEPWPLAPPPTVPERASLLVAHVLGRRSP